MTKDQIKNHFLMWWKPNWPYDPKIAKAAWHAAAELYGKQNQALLNALHDIASEPSASVIVCDMAKCAIAKAKGEA